MAKSPRLKNAVRDAIKIEMGKAEILMTNRDFSGAVAALRAAEDLVPEPKEIYAEFQTIHLDLARAAMEMQRCAEALEHLQLAGSGGYSLDLPVVRLMFARCYLETGSSDLALREYRRARDLISEGSDWMEFFRDEGEHEGIAMIQKADS